MTSDAALWHQSRHITIKTISWITPFQCAADVRTKYSLVIRLEARLRPNIVFTSLGDLAVFTCSTITPPKVNRFGWNLEHSEYIVGGWPYLKVLFCFLASVVVCRRLSSSFVVVCNIRGGQRACRRLFSERSRSPYCIAGPSVCLSVTFVHPTQPVEIFGNVSSLFPILAMTSTENFTEIGPGWPLRCGV